MTQPPDTAGGASDTPAASVDVPAADESERVERTATGTDRGSRFTGLWRNLALIVALAVLFVLGWASAPDTFMTSDNIFEILRLASVIGVVSIGMTFVITGGGIDLSVGAIVALCTVWATTTSHAVDGRRHPLVRGGGRLDHGGSRLRSGQRPVHCVRQCGAVHDDARHARRGERVRRAAVGSADADADRAGLRRLLPRPNTRQCLCW